MTRTQSTDPRVVGGTYRSGYWQRTYTVIEITTYPDGFTVWTCAWDDGTTTRHCTTWDARRDSIVPD